VLLIVPLALCLLLVLFILVIVLANAGFFNWLGRMFERAAQPFKGKENK
jgi:Na+/H+ antiporter NhaD/arsenite permease-like protein